ncbi:MAG: DUF3466 family protein [Phycisphaerales bacterium]|nr:DUF3466 family protein [Phycisphaerales bacterium]
MKLRAMSTCAGMLGGAALCAAAMGQAYTVTDLNMTNAYGINNNGQVCGSTLNYRPGRWTAGVVLDLGTFGGSEGYADKINDSGHVCGAADLANGNRVAFFYDGSLHNLGTLGGTESDGRALNNSGIIVGGAWTAGNALFRPFRYQNSQMVDLGSFGGTYTAAEGINDFGVIVGWSDYNSVSSRRAFRYENNQMVDLGTLGGISVANDINNGGRIVGYSENAQDRARAFVYTNNQMYNLGVLPGETTSYADAINNKNQIVGRSGGDIATIYQPTGPKNLNDFIAPNSGWNLRRAQDINDSGQIVGLAYKNGQNRAFLLTPIQLQLANPVPGLPGQNNTFTISACTPGKRVYLTYSLQAGTTNIEAYCYGVSLDLRQPVVAGSAIANNNGVATFVGFTPNGAAGRTVRYQALELDSCRKTNRVDWTY